jgi:hypothetical protein
MILFFLESTPPSHLKESTQYPQTIHKTLNIEINKRNTPPRFASCKLQQQFWEESIIPKTIHINMNIEILKRYTPPNSIPMMSGTNMNTSPLHQLSSSKSSSSSSTTVIAEDTNKLSESEHPFNKSSCEALSCRSPSKCSASEEEVDAFSLQEEEEDRAYVADKSVVFDDTIQVREHAVTVGVSPAVNDSCPITLDWSFVEYSKSRTEPLAAASVERSPCVRRLDLKQRRQRISSVQGWHREQVRALEIERVLEHMEEIPSHVTPQPQPPATTARSA